MEPRERIIRSALREPVDRPGLDYTATPEFHQIFKDYLGVADDEALFQRIGRDLRRVAEKYVGPPDRATPPGGAGAGCDLFGADGGYILCAAHALQADTPPENVMAMYETARAWRF